MVMKQITLSEDQMLLVRQATEALPHEWRERFLNSLADALLPCDVLSDNLVAQCATDVIARLFDGKVVAE